MRAPLKLRAFAVIGVLVMAGAFGLGSLAASGDPARDDAYAAALGYAAEQLATGRVCHVCIGIGSGPGAPDPNPRFLERFAPPPRTDAKQAPPAYAVHGASACKVSKEGATLKDGRTPALDLRVTALDRVSEEQILVEVLHVFTWRQRGIRTYDVRRLDTPQGPRWRVAGEVLKQAPF